MKVINIAKEFSAYPVGRFYTDGPDSGERFREEFLAPAMKDGGLVRVELGGTEGYGSSFLEEAFGGVVRKFNLSEADVATRLELVADDDPVDQSYLTETLEYIANACRDNKRK
ncbi:protein of unknown function [Duganella sp. CF458]|uniref:STAS-like domain-containing protein n=1 Tax=Duganella sp. CF458 TaxID=1884368 RepID=UPI0008E9F539|nr:STAS-like domain-containing protein [Duganella sp. CF458]SFF82230.1 protein of unknown function [Duganella sp. CF458]